MAVVLLVICGVLMLGMAVAAAVGTVVVFKAAAGTGEGTGAMQLLRTAWRDCGQTGCGQRNPEAAKFCRRCGSVL